MVRKKEGIFDGYITTMKKRKNKYKKRIIKMIEEDCLAFSQAINEIVELMGFGK